MNTYIAQLIIHYRVEGESRGLVHRNFVLLFAESASAAYLEGINVGKAQEVNYTNPEGKGVQCIFRGVSELSRVHEPLEHGAELMFSEIQGATDDDIAGLLRKPEEFSAMREAK